MPGHSNVIVFLGPSLPWTEAQAVADFDYRAPACQGDIVAAAAENPGAIILVDGGFGSVPSVWHKEILWALDHGIAVHGAASMGALRASELGRFGMTGHGKIYSDYARGLLTDDDEVAVIHGPAALGWIPLSAAMVDIRATIAAAREAGSVDENLAQDFLACAKDLIYSDRNYGLILDRLRASRGVGALDRLAKWIAENGRSQKKLDTVETLTSVARTARNSPRSRQSRPRFVATVHWTHAFGRGTNGRPLRPFDRMILNEIRLRPDLYAQLEPAALKRVHRKVNSASGTQAQRVRSAADVRHHYRHALDAAILDGARRNHCAAQFEKAAKWKLAQLRSMPALSDRPRIRDHISRLSLLWDTKYSADLIALGAGDASACNASRILGFDSPQHFDATLLLEEEYRRYRNTGDSKMPTTTTDSPRPYWAVWIYMASENDPNDPTVDFEGAAARNVSQLQDSLPLHNTEYFIAKDRRTRPEFIHLFGSVFDPNFLKDDVNTGKVFSSVETLAKFFRKSVPLKSEKPDKTMLILWGHGSGMRFLSDPVGADQVMNVTDFALLFPQKLPNGKAFDILGFDCCFMAHLETMYQLRRLAKLIIAGPSAIPAMSWPYHNLATVLEDRYLTAEDDELVAQSIAVAARESFLQSGDSDSPVLVFKTEALCAAVKALNELGDCLLDQRWTEKERQAVMDIARKSRRLARGHYNAPDFVEIDSFAKGMLRRLKDAKSLGNECLMGPLCDTAEKLLKAARETLVIAAPVRGGNAPRSLTIWFPLDTALYNFKRSNVIYDSLEASHDGNSGWARFLRELHQVLPSERDAALTA